MTEQSDSLTVTSEPSAAAWDAFIEQHPSATGYHTWAWRDAFQRAFGHKSIYLAATASARSASARSGAAAGAGAAASAPAIVGVLPLVVLDTPLFGRFAVSLPFVNYGGIVASEPRVVRALADEAARLAAARKWKHIEIRHLEQQIDGWTPKRHKVAMTRELPEQEAAPPADPEKAALWLALDRKVRNQIRKAQKSSFTSAIGGAELLGDFYGVFKRTMRDLGTPVYPRRFFEEVLRACPGRARVFVVRHEATPVAASITIGWRTAVEVPWAASLKEYRPQNPNMLLYWDMLRTAQADGYRTFDFGRSTPDEGTFHFKRQWGAQQSDMCWEYWLPPGKPLPNQSPDNPKYKAAVALWQKLPLGVTTFLGPHIVRGIP